MRLFLTAAILAFAASASWATTFNPQSFFTAYDQGNNGFGIADPTPGVVQQSDFILNNTFNPVLLRASQQAGTANRKSTAFLYFDLGAVDSVSSATLDFENFGNFILNTTGFPAATPDIKVRSAAIQNTTNTPVLGSAIASAGAAALTFTAQSPHASQYALDVTGLFNAALAERDTGEIIALMFDIDVPFANLPNDVRNAGFGNVQFTGFELDAIQGAAPSAVPVPAGLPLLLVGLGGFAIVRRKRS